MAAPAPAAEDRLVTQRATDDALAARPREQEPPMHVVRAMLASAILATAALAGCGGGSGGEPAATERSTEATLPEPVSASGAERTKLEDRLLEQLDIPYGPDWMVAAFDSLWVKRDDGTVLRIDPQTAKTVAQIPPPDSSSRNLCQGIGASETAVWACVPGGDVVRIDPSTNEVSATAGVDKFPDQGRIVSAAGRAWVLTDSGATLTPLDDRAQPGKAVPLDGSCADLAADGTWLWATCPQEDRVLRIDAAAGEVVDTLELAGAANASVGRELWVGFDDGVAQLDRESLEVLAVYDVSPAYGGSVFAGAGATWVREEGGAFLTRIDPGERRIVETISAPRLPSGGDVVQIGGSVWATAYDDATLVELSAR